MPSSPLSLSLSFSVSLSVRQAPRAHLSPSLVTLEGWHQPPFLFFHFILPFLPLLIPFFSHSYGHCMLNVCKAGQVQARSEISWPKDKFFVRPLNVQHPDFLSCCLVANMLQLHTTSCPERHKPRHQIKIRLNLPTCGDNEAHGGLHGEKYCINNDTKIS